MPQRTVAAALFVLTLFVSALFWAPLESRAAQRAPAGPPNLLFVLSDQQSWDMLRCNGNPDVVTPNFDRLAAQGVRFTHCISNSPVCTPYRGILLTGQHPLYCGAMQNDLQVLPGKGNYFGEVLRDAGYRTGYFGKWHLYGGDRVRPIPAGPFRLGFDNEFLTNNCTLLYDAKRAFYWDSQGRKQLYGQWEPYGQTAQAMAFIERYSDRPFALFLSWHPPHNWGREHEGYLAPEDCLELYDPAKLHLRPNVEDTESVRRKYQGHMAMITSLDRSFGRLLDQLDSLNLTDNTLVVFTSDHGDMLMSYGWPNNKGRAEDGSCRVPLLMRFPGRLPKRRSDLLIGTFDLMPTVLSLLDLPVPDSCQGRDLARPVREGKDDAVEFQPLFFLPADWRGIYTRQYTLSFSVNPDSAHHRALSDNLLYDHVADPDQLHNLFDSAQHREIRTRLYRQTHQWMTRFGDTGFRFNDLLRTVVREDDWPSVSMPPQFRLKGWDGRLKGRPVDFLPLENRDLQAARLLKGLVIRPIQFVTVKAERMKLAAGPPRGWAEGTKLQGLRPHGPGKGVPAPGAIDVDSIVVRINGRVLKKGVDYLADPTYGTLGLAPGSSVTAEDEVLVDYRFSLRRVDSICLTGDRQNVVREGTPQLTTPRPPRIAAGESRLANVLVDYFSDGKTVDVFPIEMNAPKAKTFSTPGRIPRTMEKLRRGQPVRIVTWGDSVTAGGDASSPERRYPDLMIGRLKTRFPSSPITLTNVAVGGSNSRQWLYPDRFPGRAPEATRWQRIVEAKPDLVTIEFVNDAGLTPQQVNQVYADILARLRKIGAEVILITPHFTRPAMMRMRTLREPDTRPYVLALRKFAERHQVALADASSRWAHLFREGLPYVTLLANGINHPDDRGHAIFADELMRCFAD